MYRFVASALRKKKWKLSQFDIEFACRFGRTFSMKAADSARGSSFMSFLQICSFLSATFAETFPGTRYQDRIKHSQVFGSKRRSRMIGAGALQS